jgi:hypothetical protein
MYCNPEIFIATLKEVQKSLEVPMTKILGFNEPFVEVIISPSEAVDYWRRFV